MRNSAARRQQDDIDRYVEFALSDDAVIRRTGINQLAHLLESGKLSPAQANAAAEAMRAALRRAGDQVAHHPDAATVADPGAFPDPLGEEWDSEGDTDA